MERLQNLSITCLQVAIKQMTTSKIQRARERGKMCVPREEKGLVHAVEDIDNEIVIGNRVNVWTWELPIDKYSLQINKAHVLITLIQIRS